MQINNYIKIILITFAILQCLVGCNNNVDTPESVAEKYMSELKSDILELGSYSAFKHDNRSAVLIYNEQADSIISGGQIPTYSELSNKYFEDDRLFYRWELMDISYDTIDVNSVWDFTHEGGEIERKAILDIYKEEGGEYDHQKLCKITDDAAVILKYKDVTIYKLKYKVDKTHKEFVGDNYKTAEVGVIKHPEYGYKVVSFTWKY